LERKSAFTRVFNALCDIRVLPAILVPRISLTLNPGYGSTTGFRRTPFRIIAGSR
jgi:hypothetical protein